MIKVFYLVLYTKYNKDLMRANKGYNRMFNKTSPIVINKGLSH